MYMYNRHAEVVLIDHLRHIQGRAACHVGVSTLSCLSCMDWIKALNQTIKGRQWKVSGCSGKSELWLNDKKSPSTYSEGAVIREMQYRLRGVPFPWL